jgi:aryl sulfotransferase
MKNVTWLASYPKSGNTWTRAFLTALMGNVCEVNINGLGSITIASAVLPFEFAVGMRVSDLTEDQVETLRPKAHQFLADRSERHYFLKVHDAYIYTSKKEPMFPTDATHSAICLIRNPLDVAISWANHSNITIEESVKQLCNPKQALAMRNINGTVANQLRQKMMTWSEHVESWVFAKEINVLPIRYEDMKADAVREFTKMVEFTELDKTKEEIIAAEEQCRFEKLKKQEEEKGFREKRNDTSSFFYRGQTGYWKDELSEEQIEMIIKANSKMMKHFGYIDENGEPL